MKYVHFIEIAKFVGIQLFKYSLIFLLKSVDSGAVPHPSFPMLMICLLSLFSLSSTAGDLKVLSLMFVFCILCLHLFT